MSAPRRVAILGGGAAAMSAAYELTRPELAGQYDVTVHQLGWRLGGKGASGRNQAVGNRIEEHGLHIWMGFYDNAFSVMRGAYDEMHRTAPPLQTLDAAFKKHSYIVLEEPFQGQECRWQIVMPENGLEPGVDPVDPSIWELTSWALQWLYAHWFKSPPAKAGSRGNEPIPPDVERLVKEVQVRGGGLGASPPVGFLAGHTHEPPPLPVADAQDDASARFGRAHLLARDAARRATSDGIPPSQETIDAILLMLRDGRRIARGLLGARIDVDFLLYQIWVAIDLGVSATIGILADDVIFKGWDSIDGLDLRAWLGMHGADATTLASAPLRGVYDLVFGYVDGVIANPQFAAGTAMRGMLRMIFSYRGAIFYKMQAGMGDTVFTPLYEVLLARGVKFEFFHKVTDVRVDAEGVLAVDLVEQVQLEGPSYTPVFPVLGLPCWPSAPLYDQIVDGAALQASGINLESTWAPPWKGAKNLTLQRGVDFDLVLLGISVGALQESAPSLLTASPPLAATFENVKTVQTCAFQLWMTPELSGLGWQDPPSTTERPVLGAFVEPLDTWADMSQLLVRETWPTGYTPGNVAYFCGVLDQPNPIPPPRDGGFPARELGRLDAMAIPFLNSQIGKLWPGAVTPSGEFDWSVLVDLENRSGQARFASQFRRVNIDPTERYVLSVPGSTAFRIAPDGTGIANLYVTGDWIYCGLNAGCVEAAVTGGMLAARAITGSGPPVHGTRDRVVSSARPH
jgi:uncharacterized protein with NAD-binding domain and iron-sulfur cluster